jgi:alpha-D-ribose 1-methylphosphonate 5-triphosphate synthase subunit PhnH
MRPGLVDPVLDSQRIFRGVLDAMSSPGWVVTLAPKEPPLPPLNSASLAICLALVDLETPMWLDAAARTAEVMAHLRFHCGCRIVDEPAQARFALVVDAMEMPALDRFDAGTDEYPDRSATMIVQTRTLTAGAGRRLAGPGIESEAWLEAGGLAVGFWQDFRANRERFPCGVDVLLTSGGSVAALPRTTRVEA